MTDLRAFLDTGGPALWVIGLLSILTLAIVLWKLWDFTRLGVWARGGAEERLGALLAGTDPRSGGGLRSRFVGQLAGISDLPDPVAREEITRLAHRDLADLRGGLRALELVMTIAPLIGLLGTVLGMIDAFQALEDRGGQADPSVLAGGIWEALLTTAAGMAVAIPAAIALSWFEGVIERVQHDLEDMATRFFTAPRPGG